MSTYSNWREDLIEVIDTPTTEDKAEKKIKETKVNNKVVINPTFKEAVAEMGGQILEVAEVDDKKDTAGTKEDPQIKSKEKRAGMIKRQVLLKKLQAVRAGGGTDITAGYEPEGEVLDERLGGKGYKPYTSLTGKKVSGDWEDSDRGAGNKAKKRAGGKVEKKSPTYRAHVLNKEDYETKKTSEVLAAFKRDPKVRKRFEKAAKKEDGPGSVKNRAADSMLQTAKDTAKRKGDTSKSDDRYAYEEVVHESKGHKYDDSFIEGETGSKNARRNLTRAMSSTKVGMGKPAEDQTKRRERHKADRGVKTKGTKAGHSGSAYPKMEKTLDDTYPHKKTARLQRKLADRKAGRKHVDDTHHSLKKKTVGEKLPKVNEGVMKFVKSIGKKKEERKAQKATDAGARARRKLQQKDHETVNFLPMEEEKEKGLDGKACWKGYRLSGTKKKGGKTVDNCVKEEDKAFNFVVNKLKAKYGSGVMTKGDKMPEPSAAQKKKNAEIRAKRAKEDHRDPTEKASDGRYSDRYSNRGSD